MLRKGKELTIDKISNLVNNITMTDKNNNILIELEAGDQTSESVNVLVECIDLQIKKGRDYQSAASTVSNLTITLQVSARFMRSCTQR